MDKKFKVIILAAGKGTRMKSNIPKVLFKTADKPMIDYVIDVSMELEAEETIVVIGSGAELLTEHLKDKNVKISHQIEQRGTADAVMAASNYIKDYNGKVLILCGDMPLIEADSIKKFIQYASESKVSFISVNVKQPKGYGRVIRDVDGSILKIVEEKDADEYEKKVTEINTGIYLADSSELLSRLSKIDNNNAQKEYYLTDIVRNGASVYKADNETEFLGINDRAALSEASKIIYNKRAIKLMLNGVSILDPATAYISSNAEIENDVTIYPNTFIEGKTIIKSGTTIFSGCRIVGSVIEENCEIKDNSLIEVSYIGSNSSVGPMAHLRPGSHLLGDNKIGNFVETKKIMFGKGSKASHLTYLGDAEIGENVNVGCGTITCNYDGISKHKTKIGNNVFVGSDVQFVAPVEIGDNALIGAGSTITKDVPSDSLGITRAEQKNYEGWVIKWKAKKEKK